VVVMALGWRRSWSTKLVRRGQRGDGGSDVVHHDKEHVFPPGFDDDPRAAQLRKMMAAEEASLGRGFFGHVLTAYEHTLRRALKYPIWLALFCALLIVGSYVCYLQLGRELLPAFDEGGFVLDYVMPPGSSLQETNRVLAHVESILRATPEVESTSRRTGLELGLAAVTEPNTGDI